MVSDDDLIFANHLRVHEHCLTGDAERDAFWHYEAQEIHALSVIDAIGSLQSDLVSIGQQIGMCNGYHQLVFGVARRSKFIWGANRQLLGLIAPNRREPLSLDDANEAARALNDIYIHLLGALDNYAWALIELFGNKKARSLHRNDVGLFTKEFRKLSDLCEFHGATENFVGWQKDIRQRRDPVAHRIPLSVPPAFQDDETIGVYRELEQKYSKAFGRFVRSAAEGPFEVDGEISREVDRWHSELQKVGKFAPFIVHDPNEDMVRIYPTVPEDVGTFVRIARQINDRIVVRLRDS